MKAGRNGRHAFRATGCADPGDGAIPFCAEELSDLGNGFQRSLAPALLPELPREPFLTEALEYLAAALAGKPERGACPVDPDALQLASSEHFVVHLNPVHWVEEWMRGQCGRLDSLGLRVKRSASLRSRLLSSRGFIADPLPGARREKNG